MSQMSSAPVRFMTADPGHFHAALVHKERYPEVDRRVAVYAPVGPDLIEHLKRMTRFNLRSERPTDWELDVHACPDFFERLLREKSGNTVVFSGRNRVKIDRILAAVEAGLNVLADKPWIIRHEDMPKLKKALELAAARGLVAYDIMTERYEITTMLQRELVNDPEVFGRALPGSPEDPGVSMRSVHHIMKMVAGAPNPRPEWFFDINEQGEALADVGTHLVDMAAWLLFPDQSIDHERDIQMLDGSRWPTVMSPDEFARVTGSSDFPGSLRPWVRDGRLEFYCNTRVTYLLRGVHVKLDVLWDYASSHDDLHQAVYRGERANVEVRQGEGQRWRPETYVVPSDPSCKSQVLAAVNARIAALQERWPGVGAEDQGKEILLTIPDRFRVGHEHHFAEVTERFLHFLKNPGALPAWETPNMLAKYYVSTAGTEFSRRNA